MAYRIFVNPAARVDIIETIEWYNEQQSDLGFRFYKHAQTTIKNIQKNPSGFAVRYKNIRTATIHKFPYMIHYKVDMEQQTIFILAVICTFRDPKTWVEKIK